MNRRVRRALGVVAIVLFATAAAPSSATALAQSQEGEDSSASDDAGDESEDDDDGCGPLGDFELGDLDDLGAVQCAITRAGTFAAALGVAVLGLYVIGGFVFRFVPVSANQGPRGTIRRAREQLPFVGRAYKPVVDVKVTAANGEATERSRTFRELLIHEMQNASRTGGFSERITGEPSLSELVTVLEQAPGFYGKAVAFLAARLPQERFTLRVQLLESLPEHVGVSVEIIDRKKKSVDSAVIDAERSDAEGDDRVGHEVLVAGTAAWLAYRMYDASPGSSVEPPRPVNTSSAESYGEFREGVTFEKLRQPERARTAYLRSIDIDPVNVGALVNLALLDMRSRNRSERAVAHLRTARSQVDGVQDPLERMELLGRIQYVTALVSLNRLALKDAADVPGIRPLLAQASSALRNVARLVDRAGERPELHLPWQKAEQKQISEGLEAYRDRTIAVAAGLAVERERLDANPGAGGGSSSPEHAIRVLAGGGRLSFAGCRRLVQNADYATVSPVSYSLACAHARRGEASEAVDLLREVLAADTGLAPWALPLDGDPSFDEIRRLPSFVALAKEHGVAIYPGRWLPAGV